MDKKKFTEHTSSGISGQEPFSLRKCESTLSSSLTMPRLIIWALRYCMSSVWTSYKKVPSSNWTFAESNFKFKSTTKQSAWVGHFIKPITYGLFNLFWGIITSYMIRNKKKGGTNGREAKLENLALILWQS